MLDLALAVMTGGRQHWYNADGELIITSRPRLEGNRRCQVCGNHLSHGEAYYSPEIKGFLCWIHDLQRIITAHAAQRAATAKTNP